MNRQTTAPGGALRSRVCPTFLLLHREEDKPTPAGTSSQDLAHRYNFACKSVPAGEYLQGFS